jgi:NAD(P)-dependent dehydrogenase (short-subunit alcohol dehydrogenase family)
MTQRIVLVTGASRGIGTAISPRCRAEPRQMLGEAFDRHPLDLAAPTAPGAVAAVANAPRRWLACDAVPVGSIAPGRIDTARRRRAPAAASAAANRSSLVRRLGEPTESAAPAARLLLSGADNTTGQTPTACGGLSAGTAG